MPSIAARIGDWLGTEPKVLRALFDVSRVLHPILLLGDLAVVCRWDDVVEVLQRDGEFSVEPIYRAKMKATSGDFLLGMDNGPLLQRELTILHLAMRPEDLEKIRALIARECAKAIDAAAGERRLDIVSALSHPIPAAVVAEIFGVPGPDEATLRRWMRSIFREIFLNPSNDREIAEAAAASSTELGLHLDQLIVERRAEIAAGTCQRDDFLTRLVRLQADPETRLDDEGVRRNVGGVIVGAVDTVSRAVAQSLDDLLDRPPQLRGAGEAARAGDARTVVAYAFESLRFNPQNPLLMRRASRDLVIAEGSSRECIIPEGTTVIAATLSAMFDPEKFPQPNEYRLDRPFADHLFFGRGVHMCFGQHVARLLIPEILGYIYRLPNLRRAGGDAGRMRRDGPFPQQLLVEFDA